MKSSDTDLALAAHALARFNVAAAHLQSVVPLLTNLDRSAQGDDEWRREVARIVSSANIVVSALATVHAGLLTLAGSAIDGVLAALSGAGGASQQPKEP